RNESGIDVRFAGTLRFTSGVVAHFDAGLDVPVREQLEVVSEEGSLLLTDPWHAVSPRIELRTSRGVQVIEPEPGDPYRLELENLSEAIRGDSAPLLGREDALGQARALEALFRSAERGEPVVL